MIMKKGHFLIVTLLLPLAAMACPECERSQPGILKGIGHGAGPQQQWDYVIVILTSIIVLISLYYSIKWIILTNKPFIPRSRHYTLLIFIPRSITLRVIFF